MTGPARPGVGVFRQLLHIVDTGAYVLTFRGVPLHVARCGAVTVATQPGHARPWPWCPACRRETRG